MRTCSSGATTARRAASSPPTTSTTRWACCWQPVLCGCCTIGCNISAAKLVLLAGIATLGVTGYLVSVVPDFLIRFLLWMIAHTLFRIRIVGGGNVPFRGPALLVANHMSHVDGFLIGACIQRFVRFMVWRPYYEMKSLHWFFRMTKAIPVGASGPARPGRLAPDGAPGTGRGARGVYLCRRRDQPHRQHAPVQTRVREDRRRFGRAGDSGPPGPALGQRIQFRRRPVLLEMAAAAALSGYGVVWPVRCRPLPARAKCGRPSWNWRATPPRTRKSGRDLLPLRFVRSAKRNWRKFAMADSSGRELTYGRALTASLLLAGWVRQRLRGRRDGRLAAPALERRRAGQSGRRIGWEGSGEPELHGWGRSDELGHRTVPHSHHSEPSGCYSLSSACKRGAEWCSWRTS